MCISNYILLYLYKDMSIVICIIFKMLYIKFIMGLCDLGLLVCYIM